MILDLEGEAEHPHDPGDPGAGEPLADKARSAFRQRDVAILCHFQHEEPSEEMRERAVQR